MKTEELFAQALFIDSPWFVEKIDLNIQNGELNIFIDFERGSEFAYEDHELGIKEKCLRFLTAHVPRVDIGNGKVRRVRTPWEGESSGFTLMFEAFALELLKMLPVHQACRLLGTYDKKLWDMMHIYTEKAREVADYSNVKRLGVEETAARRGHDYVSLFVDLDEKKTIFVTEGRGSETVDAFARDLQQHQGKPEQIREVACDMSPAFIKGVNEQLPEAEIVFDHFHVVKIINQAVDKVRRQEAATNPLLRSTRYIFLKNRRNHTGRQTEMINQLSLSSLNLKTVRAYPMKEAFQQIYVQKDPQIFLKLLRKRYFWATHSRLEPMKQAAYTIKRHWYGIVNWVHYKIDNGILEGFNSIFQAAKAKGYKSTQSIQTIIYMLTGKLDFSRINPTCLTH